MEGQYPQHPAVYEFSTRIRYSELTHNGQLSLPALIDLFQDCSIFHSEKIGFGPSILRAQHKAWVLTHWHIVVDRYPRLDEPVTVGTFASGFKSVSAHRNFYLRAADDTLIARANSTWGFIDLTAGKPLKPTPEHVAAYNMKDPLEMPPEPRRVELPDPDALATGEAITVQRNLIDTNEHVNNSQYVRLALGALPHEITPHIARVDYRRSATLGDVIIPAVAVEPDRCVVVLSDPEGVSYGVVELS